MQRQRYSETKDTHSSVTFLVLEPCSSIFSLAATYSAAPKKMRSSIKIRNAT